MGLGSHDYLSRRSKNGFFRHRDKMAHLGSWQRSQDRKYKRLEEDLELHDQGIKLADSCNIRASMVVPLVNHGIDSFATIIRQLVGVEISSRGHAAFKKLMESLVQTEGKNKGWEADKRTLDHTILTFEEVISKTGIVQVQGCMAERLKEIVNLSEGKAFLLDTPGRYADFWAAVRDAVPTSGQSIIQYLADKDLEDQPASISLHRLKEADQRLLDLKAGKIQGAKDHTKPVVTYRTEMRYIGHLKPIRFFVMLFTPLFLIHKLFWEEVKVPVISQDNLKGLHEDLFEIFLNLPHLPSTGTDILAWKSTWKSVLEIESAQGFEERWVEQKLKEGKKEIADCLVTVVSSLVSTVVTIITANPVVAVTLGIATKTGLEVLYSAEKLLVNGDLSGFGMWRAIFNMADNPSKDNLTALIFAVVFDVVTPVALPVGAFVVSRVVSAMHQRLGLEILQYWKLLHKMKSNPVRTAGPPSGMGADFSHISRAGPTNSAVPTAAASATPIAGTANVSSSVAPSTGSRLTSTASVIERPALGRQPALLQSSTSLPSTQFLQQSSLVQAQPVRASAMAELAVMPIPTPRLLTVHRTSTAALQQSSQSTRASDISIAASAYPETPLEATVTLLRSPCPAIPRFDPGIRTVVTTSLGSGPFAIGETITFVSGVNLAAVRTFIGSADRLNPLEWRSCLDFVRTVETAIFPFQHLRLVKTMNHKVAFAIDATGQVHSGLSYKARVMQATMMPEIQLDEFIRANTVQRRLNDSVNRQFDELSSNLAGFQKQDGAYRSALEQSLPQSGALRRATNSCAEHHATQFPLETGKGIKAVLAYEKLAQDGPATLCRPCANCRTYGDVIGPDIVDILNQASCYRDPPSVKMRYQQHWSDVPMVEQFTPLHPGR